LAVLELVEQWFHPGFGLIVLRKKIVCVRICDFSVVIAPNDFCGARLESLGSV
jgi:hypothetical protein